MTVTSDQCPNALKHLQHFWLPSEGGGAKHSPTVKTKGREEKEKSMSKTADAKLSVETTFEHTQSKPRASREQLESKLKAMT